MPNPRSRVAVLVCALFCTLTTTAAEAKRHPPKYPSCTYPAVAMLVTRIEQRQYILAKWRICYRYLSASQPKQEGTSGFDVLPRPGGPISAGVSDEVSARRRHRAHHRARHAPAHRDLVTISTAGGPVTVAPSAAEKFRGFIGDVVARGFRGRINCFARGGHVRGSLHYSGQACDFAQHGWGKTVHPMYRVADLAAKWGLRDGCTFRDCGHIDTGRALTAAHHHGRRYARRHQHVASR